MTKQEAIETIKLALSQVEWDYPMDYAVAFNMAISAMEKQIPKKPNYYKEEDIFVKDLFFVYTYCPVCEKEIVVDDMYCGCCGQAIDWEEER